MTLPLCAKVDDEASRGSLIKDGWRPIGTLLTYEGKTYGDKHPKIKWVSGKAAVPLAQQIDWSGRLWRDKKIPKETAWAETKRFLESLDYVYMMGNAAFGAFRGNRVLLIGVHPAATGLGLAKKILCHAVSDVLIAGTYADNESAKRVYESLEMQVTKEQWVFHKDVK